MTDFLNQLPAKGEAWCNGGEGAECACAVPPMSGPLEEVELPFGAACVREVVHTAVVDVTDKNVITMDILNGNGED